VGLDSSATRLLQHGADIVGSSAGFALDYFLRDPSGAGGPVGTLLAAALKEFASRALSDREQARVGGAFALAVERISARLVAGHQLRSDSFTQAINGTRAPSAELFDAVLLKARDAYEERKVKYLGVLFANVAFADGVSFETANLLVRHLDRLSYRQLCILALVAKHVTLDMEPLRGPNHSDPETEALKREEMDLHGNDLGTLGLLSGVGLWADQLSTLGCVLHELAGLDEIPVQDIDPIEQRLWEIRDAFNARQQKPPP
jgi:hypothetical protein